MRKISLLLCLILTVTSGSLYAKKKNVDKPKNKYFKASMFSALKFRNIGPAFPSGRIADIAVNPDKTSEYYVGVAAGNVWKTTNSGITWKPVFDRYGSWSVASVVIDPNNHNVVWVGTGEYNSQRAIGYGDGVYKSEDGGKSFKNMGLKKSEHIGRIAIDPRNSDVYVAVQGPLWGPGGDRGLYKTTDGGKTWKKILFISENTGINDIVIDPRNPDILYASSYMRRRHVYTLINGGPESAIYKSVDGGKTWDKLKSGLPSGNVGRIGLAISKSNPDYIYAIIEASEKAGGIFRSTDRGASWEKRSSYMSTSPQYYNRIFVDPKDCNKLYVMDTFSKVSVDGGKTFKPIGNKHRHVDDHALWIDPDNTSHLLIGCDGGLYETFDSGKNWDFKENLPVTQFYRVSVDNSKPFYNVAGGTQDNNSVVGPSRTLRSIGIVNDDWLITNGGDGFESQFDPVNPNIIYAQAQYGYLVRYDKQSGEQIEIKPQPPKGEAYRWNWNSPLIISPHSPTRLYFAANKLFRSDDRGNTWKVISPDLTRQLDRNKLPVFGKIQSPEAVAKNASTSLFGNITALDESPLVEGLLYVGTDDGLIQVSEDGGKNWRKIDKIKGVPKMTYVCFLLASKHDKNTVYAAFDGRKQNNLSPMVYKSTDRGKTWVSITSDLPERGTAYCLAEDSKKQGLLFTGTEFGIYFSYNDGKNWVQLKGGLPVTQVRDIAIQEQEDDLVIATFGRGFYILDDYSPLRYVTKEVFEKPAYIFPVKESLMFVERGGKRNMGETYFAAKNPKVGALITYYLKETPKTLKQIRKKAEKEALKNKKDIDYPSMERLQREDEEESPYLIITISDNENNIVRRLKAPASKGIHRIVWDFRYLDSFSPVREGNDFSNRNGSFPAMPGSYFVSMSLVTDKEIKPFNPKVQFETVLLNNSTIPNTDRKALFEYQMQVAKLGKAVREAVKLNSELAKKLKLMRKAVFNAPAAPLSLMETVKQVEKENHLVEIALTGNKSLSKRYENQPPSIYSRISNLVYSHWRSTAAPTTTMLEQYKIAKEEFEEQAEKLKELATIKVPNLEKELNKYNAPLTPGRLPAWIK